jgi:hypothetical protein
MKIVRILRKVFGDSWLVPGVLTVKQMFTHINKERKYSKQGLRWHERGALAEIWPVVAGG